MNRICMTTKKSFLSLITMQESSKTGQSLQKGFLGQIQAMILGYHGLSLGPGRRIGSVASLSFH